MGVAENYEVVRKRIAGACLKVRRNPSDVTIVAVTKTVDVAVIREAFEAGVRHFGENRVQDAGEKLAGLLDIRPAFTFHMIGRLQSNKAALAARLFDVIESVDSIRLARVLNERTRRKLPILIEVNVSGERSKAGMSPDQVATAARQIASLERLKLDGLMTVAPMAREAETVRPFFRELRRLRDEFGLRHLSMGMTNDFEVAVEEGATIVRIGRAIFGGEQ